MTACEVIRQVIEDNGIKPSFVAAKASMTPELLRRSLDGSRVLKADEFVKICTVLSLDLNNFTQDTKTTQTA